ncbi:MAG TPA: hydrogen gas-evolving membrane-bound hydrogenase subunit E, partial [Acidobacteriaceae bacterium]
MTERTRVRVFALAGTVFFCLYCYAAHGLPAWGNYQGPYGDVIVGLAVYERHATDVVNAINYDYRGFDTLGEEFILFTAVLGVMMLLRRQPSDPRPPAGASERAALSSTVQAAVLPATFTTIVFGLYIGLHGQLTPGGGFQAGVILATAPVLIYISQNTEAFCRITSHSVIEVVEALGAGSYALIGLMPLL